VSYTSPRNSRLAGKGARHTAAYWRAYEARRAATLRELASRSAKLTGRPAEGSRAGEIAALREPAPLSAHSQTHYEAANEPGMERQPSAAPLPAAESSISDSRRGLSPGEETELPISHSSADGAETEAETTTPSAASTTSTPSSGAAASSAENAAMRELARSSAPADAPPAEEVASLHMPISLRGSLESLERQNTRLESEGLERILDEADLSARIEHGLLVPLPASADLAVNPNLVENHRYCRPWTARFLSDLARAHAAEFHRPFQVNSAVRTVEYQKRLMRINGNAAAAEGDIVSPHLTGATIDIGKQGMRHRELMWMRSHLFALQQAGKIDVEEEFEQACFHITVYKTYSSTPAHKTAQPAMREAANRHKAAPASPGSSLPASIAASTFAAPSR
jgi:hypothetical protein